jgi:hypothetical protein
MNVAVRRFVIVFGMCVMCAILFSGCATQIDPNRVPMSTRDLNHYQINCRLNLFHGHTIMTLPSTIPTNLLISISTN